MAATFQSAIASMKAREKELSESLRAAELRAEENLRILETIAREMPGGLMIFNRERLIALSNSAHRAGKPSRWRSPLHPCSPETGTLTEPSVCSCTGR